MSELSQLESVNCGETRVVIPKNLGWLEYRLKEEEMNYVKQCIDNRKGDECLPSCHYEVWVNRIGPPLITEYDGESPADYPGDQSGHSIAGYNYDVRNELTSDDYPGDDSIDAVSNFDENP